MNHMDCIWCGKLVLRKKSLPVPLPLAAESYQWFQESCLLRNSPGPSLSHEESNSLVCISRAHIRCLPQHTTHSQRAQNMETHPRPGCRNASSRCSFSDPLSGVSEVSDLILVIHVSSASVPMHCLPLLCKPALHQPDGLKCALTTPRPVPNKLQSA